MTNIFALADGRSLEWADNGVDSEAALVFHHGTTISLDCFNAWMHAAAVAGVRAVAINRPGVGRSTRKKGRRVSDDIVDAGELLEHAGITRFVAVGWSGGAARAMGTSKLAGCIAVHTIAGVSPRNLDDPESLVGFDAAQIGRVREYLSDFDELVKNRSAMFAGEQDLQAEALLDELNTLPNFNLFEADYRAFAEDFSKSIRVALVQGFEIDSDDYFANISDWGYSLGEVNVPVTLWHGTDDDDVVFERAEYNARHLAQSELIRLEGQGHVNIMVENREQILAAAINSLQLHA